MRLALVRQPLADARGSVRSPILSRDRQGADMQLRLKLCLAGTLPAAPALTEKRQPAFVPVPLEKSLRSSR